MMLEALSRASRYWPSVALIGVLACFFGAIAPCYIERYRIGFGPAAAIYSCLVLMLALVVVPGMSGPRAWIHQQLVNVGVIQRSALILFLWSLPYLLYVAGTGDWRWRALLRLLGAAAPLLAIYELRPVSEPVRLAWQDVAVAAWLVTVLIFHELRGIWNVPANLDFMTRLFLISIASWTWVFVRRVPKLGYEFSFSRKTFSAAATSFSIFALMAIPLSLLMGFSHWNPRSTGISGFFVGFVEIFLFIALLEELFFRGFLQSLTSENLRSTWKGQAIVACLFGLFHILHAPFPNWKYVLLATLAGWFYGAAFVRSGSLMASTLAHAMVDTVWRNFF
jgi:uncharacterized protein